MSETRLLYRVHEAADMLSLSRAKVYELVASGTIRSVKIDASRRIPAQDLDLFIEQLRTGDNQDINQTDHMLD